MMFKVGSQLSIEKVSNKIGDLLPSPLISKIAEDNKSNDFLYFVARAITADVPNANGDLFPKEELEKSYESFVGKGLFVNHEANDVRQAVGKIIEAWFVDTENDIHVLCLCKVDKKAEPIVARKIESGIIDAVSMGCSCRESECSICGKKIHDDTEMCAHMQFLGREITTESGEKKKVISINRGISFNELSLVTNPADEAAKLLAIYANTKNDSKKEEIKKVAMDMGVNLDKEVSSVEANNGNKTADTEIDAKDKKDDKEDTKKMVDKKKKDEADKKEKDEADDKKKDEADKKVKDKKGTVIDMKNKVSIDENEGEFEVTDIIPDEKGDLVEVNYKGAKKAFAASKVLVLDKKAIDAKQVQSPVGVVYIGDEVTFIEGVTGKAHRIDITDKTIQLNDDNGEWYDISNVTEVITEVSEKEAQDMIPPKPDNNSLAPNMKWVFDRQTNSWKQVATTDTTTVEVSAKEDKDDKKKDEDKKKKDEADKKKIEDKKKKDKKSNTEYKTVLLMSSVNPRWLVINKETNKIVSKHYLKDLPKEASKADYGKILLTSLKKEAKQLRQMFDSINTYRKALDILNKLNAGEEMQEDSISSDISNTLILNNLIEENGNIFKITELGKQMLGQETGENVDDMKDPKKAFEFALSSKERVPELESIIMGDSYYAYRYAKEIIKDRWPEAESVISTNARSAYAYAEDVIKDRWPEGESAIMEDASYAYEYAKEVIKGRWPEGEPSILKEYNQMYAYEYAKHIIKGRWLEAEPTIMKYDQAAMLYAVEILKDRWPEAEKVIKNSVYWDFYKKKMKEMGVDTSDLETSAPKKSSLNKTALQVGDSYAILNGAGEVTATIKVDNIYANEVSGETFVKTKMNGEESIFLMNKFLSMLEKGEIVKSDKVPTPAPAPKEEDVKDSPVVIEQPIMEASKTEGEWYSIPSKIKEYLLKNLDMKAIKKAKNELKEEFGSSKYVENYYDKYQKDANVFFTPHLNKLNLETSVYDSVTDIWDEVFLDILEGGKAANKKASQANQLELVDKESSKKIALASNMEKIETEIQDTANMIIEVAKKDNVSTMSSAAILEQSDPTLMDTIADLVGDEIVKKVKDSGIKVEGDINIKLNKTASSFNMNPRIDFAEDLYAEKNKESGEIEIKDTEGEVYLSLPDAFGEDTGKIKDLLIKLVDFALEDKDDADDTDDKDDKDENGNVKVKESKDEYVPNDGGSGDSKIDNAVDDLNRDMNSKIKELELEKKASVDLKAQLVEANNKLLAYQTKSLLEKKAVKCESIVIKAYNKGLLAIDEDAISKAVNSGTDPIQAKEEAIRRAIENQIGSLMKQEDPQIEAYNKTVDNFKAPTPNKRNVLSKGFNASADLSDLDDRSELKDTLSKKWSRNR